MAKYFYYNEKGEKKGAFSGSEIKKLAKAGIINPQTVIETEEGKQFYSHGIGGVEFENDSVEVVPIRNISFPTWVNERDTPTDFLGSIQNTTETSNWIHTILVVLGIVGAICGTMLISTVFGAPLGIPLLISSIVSLLFAGLSWGLINNFLKSMRATFCHQHIVEIILKYGNNIDVLEKQQQQKKEQQERDARTQEAMRKQKEREKEQRLEQEKEQQRMIKQLKRDEAFQETVSRVKKFESEHRPYILLGLVIGAVLLTFILLAVSVFR